VVEDDVAAVGGGQRGLTTGAVSFRLVDEDGIAFEPAPRTGRFGVDLDGWADFESVLAHVR
jgi:hypothetical protein